MTERTCSVENCEQDSNGKSGGRRGMCKTHYNRWKVHGDPNVLLRVHKSTGQCEVEGCEKPAQVNKMCRKHDRYTRKFGHPTSRTTRCNDCGEEFTHIIREGHRRWYCDACDSKPQRHPGRRLDNVDPELVAATARQAFRYNVSRYGLTVEQYEAKLAAQNNFCAICGKPPKPDGVRAASRLHIDHDHETGIVRGLLCLNCNRGIGSFNDDSTLLRMAADYIDRHGKED